MTQGAAYPLLPKKPLSDVVDDDIAREGEKAMLLRAAVEKAEMVVGGAVERADARRRSEWRAMVIVCFVGNRLRVDIDGLIVFVYVFSIEFSMQHGERACSLKSKIASSQ